MRRTTPTFVEALAVGLLALAAYSSQPSSAEPAPPMQTQPCPQDDTRSPSPPPAAQQGPSDNTSDRLAASKGVICPPTGVDPEMHVKPPNDDSVIKTIPAPGTPGGDPNNQPK